MEINNANEQDYEIPFLDEIPDLIEDTKPAEIKTEKKPDYEALTRSLSERATKAENGYQEVRSERDQLTNRYGKLAIALAERGLGKYNTETGEIVLHQSESDRKPDIDSQIKDVTSRINEAKKALEKEYDEGMLSEKEYRDKYSQTVESLIEERSELKIEKRLQKLTPKTETKPDTPAVNRSSDDIKQEFSKIQLRYPDSDNQDSPLFKAMQEVYKSGKFTAQDINYGRADEKGNIVEWTGNPQKRLELIQQAEQLLSTRNKELADASTNAAANRFGGPTGATHTPAAKREGMGEEQVNVMIAGGFKSKALIKDVNKIFMNYVDGGEIIIPG